MKKLMIAAAAAAMVGGAFAGDAPQVYDFTANLKTTACSGKSAKDVCGETVFYRQQITQKLYGKFWGCGCEVIACPDNYAIDAADQNGFVFWMSTKVGGAFKDADMQWDLLQRLGKKGENVEGYFTLTLNDGTNDVAAITGAGYGTAKINCDAEEENYIKSMSGNVVGYWDATSDTIATGCYYCGDVDECTVFAFCSCVSEDNDLAAVFGTFTLKYNSSQTKSVSAGKSISEVAFKKNAAVLAVLNATDVPDDDDDDTVAKLEKKYAEAKAAYEDLKLGATECTEGKKLATVAANATTAYNNAVTAEDEALQAIPSDDDVLGATAYKTAVEQLAAVKANPASSAKDIAGAEEAVTNAKNNLPGDKVTTVVNAVDAWQAKVALTKAADEAKTAADAELSAWTAPNGGYQDALDAAEEKMNNLYIACLIAGGDCE